MGASGDVYSRFGKKRIDNRRVDQLLGICEGVIADGAVCQSEAEFVFSWLKKNEDLTDRWPANVILSRLEDMLGDGVLDEQEEGELLSLLTDVSGIHLGEEKTASTLPLCDPAPSVDFADRCFVLTGKFFTGNRKECERLVVNMGGDPGKNVTRSTDYVVVGGLVSNSWIHESYGRKIEKAVELRESGQPLSIISEEHWAHWLQRSL